MIKELCEAIMDKYKSTEELQAVLSGGMYYQQAPQDVSKPYCVFRIPLLTNEKFLGVTADRKKMFIAAVEFISITDNEQGGEEIDNVMSQVQQAYDESELEMDGFYTVAVFSKDTGESELIDDVTWQNVSEYEVWFVKE